MSPGRQEGLFGDVPPDARSMLLSEELGNVRRGLALTAAHGDADSYATLLDGVSWAAPTGAAEAGTLTLSPLWSRPARLVAARTSAVLGLIATAPADCAPALALRASVTSLQIDAERGKPPQRHVDVSGLRAFPGLTRLRVHGATAIHGLASITELPQLAQIDLDHCGLPDGIFGASQLTRLRTWHTAWPSMAALRDSPITEVKAHHNSTLRDLADAPATLQSLDLADCKQLRSLDGLPPLPALTSVVLRACPVEDLAALGALPTLHTLELAYLNHLRTLRGLAGSGSLSRLELRSCGRLPSLVGLPHGASLEHVSVHDCAVLAELSGLPPQTLRSLTIGWCDSLPNLNLLPRLPVIARLDVDSCALIPSAPPADRLPALVDLRMRRCVGLRDLRPLRGATALSRLSLAANPHLRDLTGLDDLPALTTVDLRGCSQLTDLSTIGRLPNLRHLLLADTGLRTDSVPAEWAGVANFSRTATVDDAG